MKQMLKDVKGYKIMKALGKQTKDLEEVRVWRNLPDGKVVRN